MTATPATPRTFSPADLLDHTPFGALLVSDDGLITYANPAATSMLGGEGVVHPGAPLALALPSAWAEVLAALLSGSAGPSEARTVTLPGVAHGTSHRLTLASALGGRLLTVSQPVAIASIRAELASALSADRGPRALPSDTLASLISASADIVTRIDRDLRFLFVDEAIRVFSDADPRRLIGRPVGEIRLFGDGADERYHQRIRQVLATGRETSVIDTVATERGELVLYSRLIPERDLAGEVVAVSGVTRDVTGLVQEHLVRTDTEALNQSLLDSIPDCVSVIDRRGAIVTMNAAGRRNMEIADDTSVVGDHWSVLWPAKAYPAIERAVAEAADGVVGTFVAMAPTFAGNPRWWEVVVAPVVATDAATGHVLMISRDITEAHVSERELQVSRARFQRLYDANVIGLVFVNLDGTLVRANEAFLSMTGLRRGQLAGGQVTVESITPERYWARDRRAIEILRTLGVSEPYEKEIRRADGTLVPVLVGAAATPGDIGDCIAYVVELTQLRTAERRLSERDHQLSLTLSAGTIGLWWQDLAADHLHWTDEYVAIMRLPPDTERSVAVWRSRVHPDDLEPTEHEFAAALRDRTVFDVEYRLRLADGDVRWVRSTGRAEYGEDGVPIRSSGLLIDVTERTRAEHGRVEAMQRERDAHGIAVAAETQFRSLFNGAAESILVADEVGRIIAANPGAEELLDSTERELTALGIGDITPRGHLLLGPRPQGGAPSPVRSGEHEILRRGGDLVRVESRSRAVETADGGILHYISLRDVSERRMLETLHQELIDSISHDLKNPLAAIKAQAQLLRRRVDRNRLDETYLSEAMVSINSSVERMTTQLDDLLEVARLRAGAPLELRRTSVDLAAYVRQWVAEYQRTTERHILSMDRTPGPVMCSVDVIRIERVVTNLLSNAIKYSDGGVIRVAIGSEPAAGGSEVILQVIDQGLGIPVEDLPAVFERFRRGSNVEGKTVGSGIGLAGVRQIVQQHGGTIDVESEPGVGSAFTVRLPSSGA